MKQSGIYKIQSTIKPDRCYVGSAVNIKSRWIYHKRDLRANRHHSIKLQRHYNKYGEADLVFTILVGCETIDLIRTEQFYLDSLQTYFNICKIAGSSLGVKQTEESKQKWRESHKGYRHTEESKRKISEAQKGKHHSEETKQKLREFNTGKKYLLGRKASEEAKRNMSIAQKGRVTTNVTKQKISVALKGRIVSEDTKRKISQAMIGNKRNLGRKYSEETKQKIREYMLKVWGERKKTA